MKSKIRVALYYKLVLFLLMGCNSIEITPINPIEKVEMSNWLNGANSALTLTWDDTNPNHKIIADLLDEYGYKSTFFIYPGRYSWTLNCIKDVYVPISLNGHEIGNHSMNHKDLTLLGDEELKYEINEPISIIHDLIGIWPVSFAHPYSKLNPDVDSAIFENHLFSRRSSLYSMSNRILKGLNSKTTLTQTNNWIQTSVEQGKWLIITGHGIDGGGWEPITSSFLHEMCQEISAYDDSIWVGTLAEIAAYEYLKEELNIKHSLAEENLTITITGYDNFKYDKIPSLPISIQLKLAKGIRLLNDNIVGISIDFRQIHNDYIITFDVKQMQTIVLSLAKNSM